MGLLDAALSLIFPHKCPFCGCVVNKYGICGDCFKSLPRTGSNYKKKGDFFSGCVAPLYYEGNVRESLLRFKFSSCSHYAKSYAALVYECIEKEYPEGVDIVSWVPVSKKRMRSRGYDQAKLLAEEIAKLMGTTAVPVLEKHKHVAAQSGVGSADKRKANILGAYRVPNAELVENKKILLIDDIVTTGATLSECAKTLLKSGAQQIVCAAVARDRD